MTSEDDDDERGRKCDPRQRSIDASNFVRQN